ncbi:hypothetical protein MMC27_003961 [Xylographa pallens]|nr:hypothetical protein [Xylographa pallens]
MLDEANDIDVDTIRVGGTKPGDHREKATINPESKSTKKDGEHKTGNDKRTGKGNGKTGNKLDAEAVGPIEQENRDALKQGD